MSAILVGARWEAVIKLLPQRNVVIITDNNIFRLYGQGFPDFPVLRINPGEKSKQIKVIEDLCSKLLVKGIDRNGFVLAIGGGVVCDVAGFLASVYLRGIRCGYISTSLLAQVDASTGGKTGVNLGAVKNVIGTFRQPEFVICDTTMLRTLPEEEYISGLAELIKTGLIGDKAIIDSLEKNHPAVMLRQRELMTDLVYRSVKVKASVVARDEKESGARRILNFGHTFGHAFELNNGLKHGYAVAAGMEIAAGFSFHRGLIRKNEYERIIYLLGQYGLTGNYSISAARLRELISHDKKKAGNEINFVFLKGIGKPFVEKITVREITGYYNRYYSKD